MSEKQNSVCMMQNIFHWASSQWIPMLKNLLASKSIIERCEEARKIEALFD